MFSSRKSGSSRGRRLRAAHQRQRGFRPWVEVLEERAVPALTPSQVASAYGFNLVNFGTATSPIVGNGAGETIAIIDPGDDAALVNTGSPNFGSSDLHQFDVWTHLPDPPSFTVVGETGGARPSYVGIAKSAETGNTVTITTSFPLFPSGGITLSSITIAEDGPYDGTFGPITVLNSTQFTYTDFSQTSLPTSSGGRGTINNPVNTGETTLDVEWAHGIAPAANIVLIEMTSFLNSDIANAVATAGPNGVGAQVVSMSFGSGEYPGETGSNPENDSIFVNSGMAFVAATGDNGAPGGYPAFSPNVLAAGATNLFVNGDGSYQSETGWSDPVIASATESGSTVTITTTPATPTNFAVGGLVTIAGVGVAGYVGTFTVTGSPATGLNANTFTYTDTFSGLAPSSGGTAIGQNQGGSAGGISQFESQPAYQQGTVTQVTQSTSNRTIPDVAFVGGEPTPVQTYDSDGAGSTTITKNYEFNTWGTSVSTPCWAGLIAIADQGLALKGLAPLNTSSYLQTDLYDLPLTDFHDITSGNNGFAAGPGYDLVTGIGTPVANLLIPDLAGTPAVLAYSTPDNVATGHNIVVKQVGANIDVFDNGNLVTAHPLSTTSQIDISGDDTAGTISLTVDYSGGEFTIPVNFNGGTGTGPHVLNIDNGSFANELYNTQSGPQPGTITLDSSTITFSKLSSINDNPAWGGRTPFRSTVCR